VALDKREQARRLIAQAVHNGTERPLALESALQACRIIAKYDLLGPASAQPPAPPEPAARPRPPARPPKPPAPEPPPVDWFPGEEQWAAGQSASEIPDPAEPPPDFSRMRNGKFMVAKHKGKCRWCTFDFNRGDPIYWDSAIGADHADCARERQQVEEMLT
jgi:hypothetical protein